MEVTKKTTSQNITKITLDEIANRFGIKRDEIFSVVYDRPSNTLILRSNQTEQEQPIPAPNAVPNKAA